MLMKVPLFFFSQIYKAQLLCRRNKVGLEGSVVAGALLGRNGGRPLLHSRAVIHAGKESQLPHSD